VEGGAQKNVAGSQVAPLARGTRTIGMCAFREQKVDTGTVPPVYRGGSASKKNGLPTPSHHSEAARCASTGDFRVFPLPAALAAFFSFLPGGVARLPFTARIGRAHSYRARSASKKGNLAAPPFPIAESPRAAISHLGIA